MQLPRRFVNSDSLTTLKSSPLKVGCVSLCDPEFETESARKSIVQANLCLLEERPGQQHNEPVLRAGKELLMPSCKVSG